MIRNIKQNDWRLLKVIRDYGCLFLCFAEISPLVFEGFEGCRKLNAMWKEAMSKGFISSDLNCDGDYDDLGEAEILNHNAILELFNIDCFYDNIHHEADEKIPAGVKYIFGAYKYKYIHFVVINRKKKVILDPLGESNTVKNGKLISMRWYYAN